MKFVFIGRGILFEMIVIEDEMLNFVVINFNIIGFVDEGKVDGMVKVVGIF